MFSYGRTALLLCALVVSCDNNVTISTQSSKYLVKAHVTELTALDALPQEVRTLLERESLTNKKPVKFPLAYYLIQEEDTKILYSSDFETKITGQLFLVVSGTKYYKLFVHPDLEGSYSFLRNAYRYIAPDQTEFMATPTTGERAMAVWNRSHAGKMPFIVKTEIDERTINMGSTRVPAGLSQTVLPDSIQMIFHRPIKGTKERIEGQQITKIPSYK